MTKVVIVDREENICGKAIEHTGAEHKSLANKLMKEALEKAGLTFAKISYIIATGYGRSSTPLADLQITELTCHARGVAKLFPSVKLAIDIGGQDAKGLKINNGKLLNFTTNDKCAAGTGRFLELIAKTLGLDLEDLGNLSLKSTNRLLFGSTCTVFAIQEVTLRLSEGVPIEDIVAGLHHAIASRVATMVRVLKVEPDVVFTGGVAKNIGVVKGFEEQLGCKVFVPEEPLLSGAIGAALSAKELTLKALAKGNSIQRGEHYSEEATFFE